MQLVLLFSTKPKERNIFWSQFPFKFGWVQFSIKFLKVMYLIFTLQIPFTLSSVFSETASVFLKEDTQKCVLTNTCTIH